MSEHDEKQIERLRQAARDYNSPPPTPRDEIWARIIAARHENRIDDGARDGLRGKPESTRPFSFRWRPRHFALPAAVAAMLVLAFAAGRYFAPQPGSEPGAVTSQEGSAVTSQDERAAASQETRDGSGTPPPPPASDDSARKRDLYRMAAAPVLDQAELLLTQFRTGTRVNGEGTTNGDGMSYGERASALLVDTRYLMNSPAADDPELRQLLSDLELVLAQIVRLGADGKQEKEWVDESMEGRSLLPRLRAVPGLAERVSI